MKITSSRQARSLKEGQILIDSLDDDGNEVNVESGYMSSSDLIGCELC